jgi:hypothetical protein
LQPPRKHFCNAGKLRKTKHTAIWNVANGAFSDKWNQMMLTERVNLDILHNHQLIVILFENSSTNYFCG